MLLLIRIGDQYPDDNANRNEKQIAHSIIIDILIIIFMEKSSHKVEEPLSDRHAESESPSTPKKKPKYSNDQSSSARRIKSITKMTQKQSVSLIYSLLVLIWAIALAFVLYMAFQTKIRAAEASAQRDIQTCRLDYESNRCLTPVKGLVNYCSQKFACMNENSMERTSKTVSHSRIFGEIASQYAQGAGLVGIVVGVGLIALCLKQKGKEKSIVVMEYFQDQ